MVSPHAALLSTPATIKPQAGSEIELTSPAEAIIFGICRAGCSVDVAGEQAEMNGRVFSHDVVLAPGRNLITIEVTAPGGETNTFYRELTHLPPEE